MYNHPGSSEESYLQSQNNNQHNQQSQSSHANNRQSYSRGAQYNPGTTMTPDQMRMAIISRRYNIHDVIGAGSYGCVYQAEDRQTGKSVAIKKMQRIFDDLVDCKRILREVSLLSRMHHNNTVRLLDMIIPDPADVFDEIYLVLEIADSDFKKLFRAQVHLTEAHVKTLLYNMLIGLRFIHACGVLHRDIKPANCLVNTDCTVKICDFGLARTTESIPSHLSSPSSSFKSNDINKSSSNPHNNSTNEADVDMDGMPNKNTGDMNETFVETSTRPPSAETTSHISSPVRNTSAEVSRQTVERQLELKKQMTGHVVTRWYRAPELILLQENYDSAVDVWSAGCIFGELLNMLESNTPSFSDRVPLFPGGSCFPLSPCKSHPTDYRFHTRDERDQLNMIFNLLGTPAPEDLEFLEKDDAKKYVRIFGTRSPQDLSRRFPGISPLGIDLLQSMLMFSPLKRLSLDACIAHPYLEEVRNPASEVLPETLPKIVLPYDDWRTMAEDELRYAFVKELRMFYDHNRVFDPMTIPVPIIPPCPKDLLYVDEVNKQFIDPNTYNIAQLPDLKVQQQHIQQQQQHHQQQQQKAGLRQQQQQHQHSYMQQNSI